MFSISSSSFILCCLEARAARAHRRAQVKLSHELGVAIARVSKGAYWLPKKKLKKSWQQMALAPSFSPLKMGYFSSKMWHYFQ